MSKKSGMNSNHVWAILAAAALLAPLSAAAQQAFPTADAAAVALVDAVSKKDQAGLRKVLGDDWKKLVPAFYEQDENVEAFLTAWAASHKIVSHSENSARLAVGAQDWELPIPLVVKDGAWHFDTRASMDEIRTRRIGRNELATMQGVLAYYDAQKEYAQADRNGDGVLEYAQKIISTPGKQDGLYWGALDGEAPSPLGPLYGGDKKSASYHGYHYRVLTAQGAEAPGGAYDYRINKRMIAGFAVVAWPVKHGDSGVTSFMVSHDGVLYEADLGAKTDSVARAMTRFNPASNWKKVTP